MVHSKGLTTVLFLAALGGGYGVAHAVGASEGWAAAAGWAAGIAVLLLIRGRGYRAASRVGRYRATAQALREQDPETYHQILDTAADGSEAEAAARRDPDAYVALFLSHAEDHASPEEQPEVPTPGK
jgi:hypothetical protein